MGRTVLMIAARAGHADVVQLLLQHGADPEAKDWESAATALKLARDAGHTEVVEVLDPEAAAAAAAARGSRRGSNLIDRLRGSRRVSAPG